MTIRNQFSNTFDGRRPRWAGKLAAATIVATVAAGLLGTFDAGSSHALRFAGRVLADDTAAGAPSPTSEQNDVADRTAAADRVREGTRWQNERGIFTLVGDRVTFTNQRKLNLVVLENLNLERIVRTIEENRTVTDADTLEWNVDATVTEFRGQNFVLVTRSVLVARPRGTDAGR